MSDKNNRNYEDNDFDTTLDALLDFMKNIPKSRFKILNKQKYEDMLLATAQLQKLLAKNNPEGQINVGLDEDFYLGYIRTEQEDLSVDDVPSFVKIISLADNFEVYPLTNGNIRIDLTFHRVFRA